MAQALQDIGTQQVTTVAQAPAAKTAADTVRHASQRPDAAALALRRAKQLRQVEASQSVSHSDSVYLYARDTTFAQICEPKQDLSLSLHRSSLQKTYIADVARLDSLSLHADSLSLASQSGESTTLIEPTPRGATPLKPYSGAAALSFVFVVVVLSVIRFSGRTFLQDLFGFLGGTIGWKRLEQSQVAQKGLLFFLLNCVYVLMLSVVIVEAAVALGPGLLSGNVVYYAVGFVAAAIVAYYFLRLISDMVIGFAFRTETRLQTLTLYRRSARSIIGILLSPCVLLMPFVSSFGCLCLTLYAGFVIIAVTLLRIGKTMRINLTDLPTILYFILYLCIVEAVPLVCITKMADILLDFKL